MGTMDLKEFAEKQIQAVEKLAKQVFTLLSINLEYDFEGLKQLRKNLRKFSQPYYATIAKLHTVPATTLLGKSFG
jgi:hypothetical protein